MTCTDKQTLIDNRINKVLTQYRESPNLLYLLRTYLSGVADTAIEICDLPSKFDIDIAVGDQLTLLGKRLGWPRCHCVCDVQPVFGFECQDEISIRPIAGFGGTLQNSNFGFCDNSVGFAEDVPVSWSNCDQLDVSLAETNSTWSNCSSGISELCINSDEMYRKFLKVRIYQMLQKFDIESLEECLRIFFGNSSKIMYAGEKRIIISPGRNLSDSEISLLQLYPRVIPTALGITINFHFGETRVFGFGNGCGGFLEDDISLTTETESYSKTGKIFGFCDDNVGGFCEEWLPEGLPLSTENGDEITNETGASIYTGSLTENTTWQCKVGAPWMCEFDVQPYSCS